VATENIILPSVEIEGFVELSTSEPDGVTKLKEALKEAMKVPKDKEVNLGIKYLSPPRYRISVSAPDYKSAEDVMKRSAEKAVSYITENGGEGRFIRDVK
jgi:translation initiation factor 2 subunit 1